jgi:hypothetical protein
VRTTSAAGYESSTSKPTALFPISIGERTYSPGPYTRPDYSCMASPRRSGKRCELMQRKGDRDAQQLPRIGPAAAFGCVRDSQPSTSFRYQLSTNFRHTRSTNFRHTVSTTFRCRLSTNLRCGLSTKFQHNLSIKFRDGEFV